ncbi:MAG: hypothetical protein Q7U74_08575, partial [Saprospiraceae bacterium]|nr:hypothetical protein [Saprospiraceae bacterium]
MSEKRPLIFDIAEKCVREIKAGDSLFLEGNDDEKFVICIKRQGEDMFLFTIDNWGNLQSSGLAAAWRTYWDSGKNVMVGATYNEPTRIGSWDNQDIELYPHGTGKVNVRNNGINIPPGKTYDVDGVPHMHAGLVRTAKQTAQITNSSNTTPADISGLYFDLVSGRRYVFKFFVTFQTAATGTGIGFVFSSPAMTAVNWKVSIRQGNAGTDQTYENSATSLTTVLVSASVAAANTDYMAIIEGFCEPSANGSLQLRCRSEVNGSQIT